MSDNMMYYHCSCELYFLLSHVDQDKRIMIQR